MQDLEKTWKTFSAGQPFVYSFLDQEFDALYKTEHRLGKIVLLFSALAISIACLGLFGLAAFTTEQRTKEIGIRKVLGASVPDIIAMLSQDFLRLVLFAIVAATPLAYMVMKKWLGDFAYRISIGIDVFIYAGFAAVAIALAAVGFQAVKAALANPVDSLRYE
jgi:putative ABC transport system permease protein